MEDTIPKYILGISAYYHDSAAALLCQGKIIAAAQEERFTRKKHDASFPQKAIQYCLDSADISLDDVSDVVFYDKPLLKFERLLETYLADVPKGFRSFVTAMPIWLKEKLYLKKVLRTEFARFLNDKNKTIKLKFAEHHQSHAASAFFPSPYNKAAVLCIDGVGEWATTSLWQGEKNNLTPVWEINFPHSLGLLYSAFTYYCGFKVNSGEYKLMGLAPYGEPVYKDRILEHIIDVKDDGSFHLNMKYFNYTTGLTMTSKYFDRLFGAPPRQAETDISQKEMDIARSIQFVTEEILLKMVRHIHKTSNNDYLCLAGGVALNCVANGELLRKSPFKDIWIQPAAGDAGGAIGCALALWHQHYKQKIETKDNNKDLMQGSYLGPEFSHDQIKVYFDSISAPYHIHNDVELYPLLAEYLNQGKVMGWFQGRMEFGPRALGGRSILGDPRNSDMQTTMNLKIKYRESFRPFAPSVLAEDVHHYFEHAKDSPYMLMVAQLNSSLLISHDDNKKGMDKLKQLRSTLPAITHVDNSARIQTVHQQTNPRYHQLLQAFKNLTDCSVLINTSFNVRGEPIVCTPEDAYRCFMRTEMDILVLENYVLIKSEQETFKGTQDWQQEFVLD
ncbi:MAG: carbamoyltransferase [gamma proteobacterium symbiont of Taylorina sp.]|nr:carbamoyltransferase [gamma proteobacterium symbiont of Taylorina sp.]